MEECPSESMRELPCFSCQYCWWKKPCTTWSGKYLIIYMFSYIPGGARFLQQYQWLRAVRIQQTRIRKCFALQISGSEAFFKNSEPYWGKWSKLTTAIKCFLSGIKLVGLYHWRFTPTPTPPKRTGCLASWKPGGRKTKVGPFLRKSSLVDDDFLWWLLKHLSVVVVLVFTQSNLVKDEKPFWLAHIFQTDWVNHHLQKQGFYNENLPSTQPKNKPQESCIPQICSWSVFGGIFQEHPKAVASQWFTPVISHPTPHWTQGHGHFQLSCLPRHGRWICRHRRGGNRRRRWSGASGRMDFKSWDNPADKSFI